MTDGWIVPDAGAFTSRPQCGRCSEPYVFVVKGELACPVHAAQIELDFAAHWARESKRLRGTLPRRVRFRLWRDRCTDKAAIWLLDHGRERSAITLWRVTGHWNR